MSYRSKLACAVTLCLIGLAGIAPAERAVANDPDLPGKGEQPTTVQMATLQGAAIISDGPLTNVFAAPDLNCAVNHADDQFGEFYAGRGQSGRWQATPLARRALPKFLGTT
jgi:hypothetical protein